MIAATQQWTNLCSPDDPLLHTVIYYGQDDGIAETPFPRCIINDTSEGGTLVMSRAGLSTWNKEGTVHATFEIEIPLSAGATTLEEQGNWFVTQTGLISKEIRGMVNPPGELLSNGEYPMELAAVGSVEGPVPLTAEEREQMIPQVGYSQLPLWIQTLEFTLVP